MYLGIRRTVTTAHEQKNSDVFHNILIIYNRYCYCVHTNIPNDKRKSLPTLKRIYLFKISKCFCWTRLSETATVVDRPTIRYENVYYILLFMALKRASRKWTNAE